VSIRRARVLIVDDSATVRQVLARELSQDPKIEVVGTAGDPYVARDKILAEKPDVLTLDIQMPKMDGLTFLRKLMIFHPLPVIVLSSFAGSGTNAGVEALESGAVDVLPKPACDGRQSLAEAIAPLAEAIKAAVYAKPRASAGPRMQDRPVKRSTPARNSAHVIAMGASTGGTDALRTVLTALPPDAPGVLVVIHMPEGFTARFAERLNEQCAVEVREARDGDAVHAGQVLIARGDSHLTLNRVGNGYVAEVRKGPPICRHRPSVEVLFQSAARAAGPKAMGVILTGMGADGAHGLLAMRKAGAYTVAQNKATSVIFGMPREAIELGAAVDVLAIDEIAGACVRWSSAETLKS
jgi:two-component system chemotaxis response regulator CheB